MKAGTKVKVIFTDDKDNVGSPWLESGMVGTVTVAGTTASFVLFEGTKKHTVILFNKQLEVVYGN